MPVHIHISSYLKKCCAMIDPPNNSSLEVTGVPWILKCIHYRLHSRKIIRLAASVCVSIRLSVGTLLFEPFDLDLWHEGRPWPWLAWDWRSRSNSEKLLSSLNCGAEQVDISWVQPIVNCEWPLPVHWNCPFVSNQGALNVSRVSGRSALLKLLITITWIYLLNQST